MEASQHAIRNGSVVKTAIRNFACNIAKSTSNFPQLIIKELGYTELKVLHKRIFTKRPLVASSALLASLVS